MLICRVVLTPESTPLNTMTKYLVVYATLFTCNNHIFCWAVWFVFVCVCYFPINLHLSRETVTRLSVLAEEVFGFSNMTELSKVWRTTRLLSLCRYDYQLHSRNRDLNHIIFLCWFWLISVFECVLGVKDSYNSSSFCWALFTVEWK